jgi:flagellar biosynthetic protein FlhB
MSEQIGEKTEQPTPKRLEEASKRGQYPRSAEVQTVVVLGAGLMALTLTGRDTWRQLVFSLNGILEHLHEIPLTQDLMQGYAVAGLLVFGKCVWPIALAAAIGGLLAGGVQSKFQTASEALELKWERVSPLAGLKRLCSLHSLVPTSLAAVKLTVVLALVYGEVRHILLDPIFYSTVSTARIAEFMVSASAQLILRVLGALVIIAAVDYVYQFWRTGRELMMTKHEVKEETKNTEGNPEIKARRRQRTRRSSLRKMLLQVSKADVVVTNPTHLAIALHYDRSRMKAPKILAKGSRLNALRIRELAQHQQIPVVENKPLARLLFKYGRVDGEIPAQLYAAVAEILAWVYRANRYRYYAEQNKSGEN